MALNNIGWLYENGYGVEQDYQRAFEYYEMSARQGNRIAVQNIRHLYYEGYIGSDEASEWL